MAADYPPEPWRLRGQLHALVFVVPLLEVPVQLPPGWRAVRVGRFGLVCTAWVHYERGGVLAYDELVLTVLVRRGWRLLPTITHIWVDSPASRDGGRALWALPKQLAQFAFAEPDFAAGDAAGPIARGTVTGRLTLPGSLRARFHIVQSAGAAPKITRVRLRARVALSLATFDADRRGPMAFLAGRRPLFAVSLREFRMTFGLS